MVGVCRRCCKSQPYANFQLSSVLLSQVFQDLFNPEDMIRKKETEDWRLNMPHFDTSCSTT